MRTKVERYSIEIIPEGITDEVFIEEVLGLKSDKDTAIAKRINVSNTDSLAYIRIERGEQKREVNGKREDIGNRLYIIQMALDSIKAKVLKKVGSSINHWEIYDDIVKVQEQIGRLKKDYFG